MELDLSTGGAIAVVVAAAGVLVAGRGFVPRTSIAVTAVAVVVLSVFLGTWAGAVLARRCSDWRSPLAR